MDVSDKVALIERTPTEETVTHDELVSLFESNNSPRHYIGLEISGYLHLGSLLSTGYKVNDFAAAGCRCTVFLADWHTVLNDKLGGDTETMKRVSEYYRRAFEIVCPKAEIVMGSDLYEEKGLEYWSDLVRLVKHMSLARTMRTLTIMGRTESDNVDLAKLLYPPMQAADIHALEVDIAHAGMDQRKIHMLVREAFPKLGWKVPVSVHQSLLPGLSGPGDASSAHVAAKMSKSSPNSGIFMHDTDDVIRDKIKRAWCDLGVIEGNALLAIAKHIVFHEKSELRIERPEKFGGNVSYASYEELEGDYAAKKLHASDLKGGVAAEVIGAVAPIRDTLEKEGLRPVLS